MTDGVSAAQAAAAELVDVIDETDTVVGTATRAEVRAGNLLHRSVFVAVITTRDEVVVHQRAAWKDVWPSRWDLCFGGVLDAGETWLAGAVRELGEEAGVRCDERALDLLGEGRFEDDRVRELTRSYVVRTDGPFTFDDGEVATSDRIPLAELASWAGAHELCDDSRALVLPWLLDLVAAP